MVKCQTINAAEFTERKKYRRYKAVFVNMLKKITSILMCVTVVFSLLSFHSVSASAANYDINRLVSLAHKFPDGKYWNHIGSSSNNPDGYTSTPCTRHSSWCGASCGCNMFMGAMQCMGYAYKLANELVGTDPRNWEKRSSLNISSLRVGDIIRYLHNGHSIVVVGVSGNTIAYTGANWGRNCLIKWGTLTSSQLRGFSYVLHDKNNNLKNTDIDFFEGIKAKNSVNFVKASASSHFEKWKNTSGKSIAVYNLPLKNAFQISTIKKNKAFKVIEKTYDGKTLWGKFVSDDNTGWVKLNKLTFTGGGYSKPSVKDVEKAVLGKKFRIKWNEAEGASSYTVRIIKKGRSGVYKTYTTEKNKLNVKLLETGNFYVYVIAQNEKAESWALQSKKVSFEVKKNKEKNKKSTKASLKMSANAPTAFLSFFSSSTAV